MWTCRACGAVVDDDDWDACWKCSAPKNASAEEIETVRNRRSKVLTCHRCDSRLEYAGTKRFHEGSRLGVFGDLAELFVKRESYDVYFCPTCGKVEFYIDGIGDADRGETEGG
ncbi:MAG: hypothetical protein KDL87_16390 [Verrucomicrobiae bacterium]|nr:hypothetical protein [Verrucomicrobiae bacterium]